MPRHGRLGGVDLDDLAAVLEIDVDLPGAIRRALFRFSAERESS